MAFKDTFFSKKRSLNFRGKLLLLEEPKVMGIVNVTPDSFYAASRKVETEGAIAQAGKFLADGADILDVGAYSSRPGADDISKDEELNRLIPVIKVIRENHPEAIISVDTFRAYVAEKLINDYQVDMINDISAGELDPEMMKVIVQYQVPYVMMHMKGTPQNMKQKAHYKNLLEEIMMYFAKKVDICNQIGIHDVILDPGFGFGKTIGHNFEILKNLETFEMFNLPLLVGISRKSMIYKTLQTSPDNALPGTLVMQTIALQKGANILRVHDVKEAKDTITLMQKYQSTEVEGGSSV